jgi:hypothetical protein
MAVAFTIRGDEVSQMWQVYGEDKSARHRSTLVREFPYGKDEQAAYAAAMRFGYYWAVDYSIEHDLYLRHPSFQPSD